MTNFVSGRQRWLPYCHSVSGVPFSRSALLVLFSCGVLLFALSVLLPAYDTAPRAVSASITNSYNASAVGHAVLYEMLRRLDFPLSRRLGGQPIPRGRGALLVLAEPDSRLPAESGAELLFAPCRLLVLPKWRGVKDEKHPGRIVKARPLPVDEAARVYLTFADATGTVVRTLWPSAWTVNELGVTPSGGEVVQLVRSAKMRPVVGTKAGMLVGELREGGSRVWVLSDPDVLSNHGLVRGDNAAFMIALLAAIRGEGPGRAGSPVVFDESLHGFRQPEDTSLRLLFSFPFSLVVLLICASGALLALAGARRFGVPQRAAPACAFGTEELIANSARMLDYAGYQDTTLRRYARMTLRAAGRALHAPPGLDERALTAWLDSIGRARGVEASCAEILNEIDRTPSGGRRALERLFTLAGNMHQWKEEILHDAGTRGQTR